jgi:hypothetical protein
MCVELGETRRDAQRRADVLERRGKPTAVLAGHDGILQFIDVVSIEWLSLERVAFLFGAQLSRVY